MIQRPTTCRADADVVGDDVRKLYITNCEQAEFLQIAARAEPRDFGYVVTPNVDHLIRYRDDAGFRAAYRDADFALLDSRFLAATLRVLRGVRLPVCTGSDLTAALFESVIRCDDSIVLIGGEVKQAANLRRRYGLKELSHLNPAMGFMSNPHAVEECLKFIENTAPFRFCFLAIGSPQQEQLAQRLKERGHAKGLALCIGGAINFLTGKERRAPLFMQKMGTEWLYRLLRNPRRMARRYLWRGPRLIYLLPSTEFILKSPSSPQPRL